MTTRLTFHTNTWRDRYSRCLQCNRKEFNGNVHSQSRNGSRKAPKAWHVRDPWVTGALCAPQSPFAHLTHSIFEAFPPFARSIPASQTVAFTTRCHQRPWLGWQIELAMRAYSHTQTHIHTHIPFSPESWNSGGNELTKPASQRSTRKAPTHSQKQNGNSFFSSGWWLSGLVRWNVSQNLVVYRSYLSVKKHSGQKNIWKSETICHYKYQPVWLDHYQWSFGSLVIGGSGNTNQWQTFLLHLDGC